MEFALHDRAKLRGDLRFTASIAGERLDLGDYIVGTKDTSARLST